MLTIRIGNTQIQPQVQGDAEYWVCTLLVPRYLAKGNLRTIWEQFVQDEGRGIPGEAFAHRPSMRFIEGDVIFRQSGGLDI